AQVARVAERERAHEARGPWRRLSGSAGMVRGSALAREGIRDRDSAHGLGTGDAFLSQRSLDAGRNVVAPAIDAGRRTRPFPRIGRSHVAGGGDPAGQRMAFAVVPAGVAQAAWRAQ